MEQLIKYKPLGIPVLVWGLQLLYVAIALGLFATLWATVRSQVGHLPVRIIYVAVVIAINVIWRVAIRRIKPGWF